MDGVLQITIAAKYLFKGEDGHVFERAHLRKKSAHFHSAPRGSMSYDNKLNAPTIETLKHFGINTNNLGFT